MLSLLLVALLVTTGSGQPEGRPFDLACAWDLSGDDQIAIQDLARLIVRWGERGQSAMDFNEDGVVGISDLALMLVRWGVCPGFCREGNADDCARVELFRANGASCSSTQEAAYACSSAASAGDLAHCEETCAVRACDAQLCAASYSRQGFLVLCSGGVAPSSWTCEDNACVPVCPTPVSEAPACQSNQDCVAATAILPSYKVCGEGPSYSACVENKCTSVCPREFCSEHSEVDLACPRGQSLAPAPGFCEGVDAFVSQPCRNVCGCEDDGSPECDQDSECTTQSLGYDDFGLICPHTNVCLAENQQCETRCLFDACATIRCGFDTSPRPNVNGDGCGCAVLTWREACNTYSFRNTSARHDVCTDQQAGETCRTLGAYCSLPDDRFMVCVDETSNYFQSCPVPGRPFNTLEEQSVVFASVAGAHFNASATATHFAKMAEYELASVASFSVFSLQLLAVGAPMDLIRASHQAALDEVRHAEGAYRLARHFGGGDIKAGPAHRDHLSLKVTNSLEDLAVATAKEACVGETISTKNAARDLRRTDDERVAQFLATVVADETRHAALGWKTLAFALERDATLAPVLRAVLEAEPAVAPLTRWLLDEGAPQERLMPALKLVVGL